MKTFILKRGEWEYELDGLEVLCFDFVTFRLQQDDVESVRITVSSVRQEGWTKVEYIKGSDNRYVTVTEPNFTPTEEYIYLQTRRRLAQEGFAEGSAFWFKIERA